jgi:hypothetical protein
MPVAKTQLGPVAPEYCSPFTSSLSQFCSVLKLKTWIVTAPVTLMVQSWLCPYCDGKFGLTMQVSSVSRQGPDCKCQPAELGTGVGNKLGIGVGGVGVGIYVGAASVGAGVSAGGVGSSVGRRVGV